MLNCPHCGEEYVPGDRFCEACSKPLPAPQGAGPITPSTRCICGSAERDEDGICVECGRPREANRANSYSAAIGPGLVGSTNIGLRHLRNEDAFALNGPSEGGPGSILVVCDGVSSSQNPQLASAVAAKAACDWAAQQIQIRIQPKDAMREAIIKAHDAVCAVPFNRQDETEPPSCTIVAAMVQDIGTGKHRVTVAWLGDSRAFWLSSQGCKQLTQDHSWVEETVCRGLMTREEAEKDRRAHAITKFLGTTDFSSPTDCMEPSIREFDLQSPGVLCLCTDGLWNYLPTAEAILQAANGTLEKSNLSEACEKLIAWANRSGGQDNITVALTRF